MPCRGIAVEGDLVPVRARSGRQAQHALRRRGDPAYGRLPSPGRSTGDGSGGSLPAHAGTVGADPARPGVRGTIPLAERRWRRYDQAMPEAIAFDTHRFVKRLTDSGFTERQAETLAEEHVALLNGNLATRTDVAKVEAKIEELRRGTKADIAKVEAKVEELRRETRADIAKVEAKVEELRRETRADIAKVEAKVEELRRETKADIAKVEAKVEAKIESSKAELLKWMVGALVAQGGLIVALVKLL